MATEAMQYKSEQDRMTALAALPDEPPTGANIEVWLKEVESKKQDIMAAPIVTDTIEPVAPSAPPAPSQAGPDGYAQAVAPQAPAPVVAPIVQPSQSQPEPINEPALSSPTDDDVMFVLGNGEKVLRKDLPDELKAYKNAKEVIKQFGHARKHANDLHEKYQQQVREVEELRSKTQQLPSLERELGELKSRTVQTASAAANIPQSDKGREVTQGRMRELKSKLAELEKLSPDDLLADPEKLNMMKSTMAAVGGELDHFDGEIGRIRQGWDSDRKRIDEVTQKVDSIYGRSQSEERERAQRDTAIAVARNIEKLQSEYPELKTNKPVFGLATDINETVEGDVAKFADRVIQARDGRPARSWAERNAVINAYNRKDQGLMTFLMQSGISPADVGTTDGEMLTYATMLNVDAMAKGSRIDEVTGQKVQLRSEVNGQPVNFPSHLAAYEYLQKTTGLSRKIMEKNLSDAERRGQDAIIRAAERGANQAKTIGRDGTVTTSDAAGPMTKDDAMRMLNSDAVDEYRIDREASKGNFGPYRMLTSAQRALGLPEMKPEPHWPKERNAQ
jgi:hypothetical protein